MTHTPEITATAAKLAEECQNCGCGESIVSIEKMIAIALQAERDRALEYYTELLINTYAAMNKMSKMLCYHGEDTPFDIQSLKKQLRDILGNDVEDAVLILKSKPAGE